MFPRTTLLITALALVLGAGPASARTLGEITFEPCDLRSPRALARVDGECARFEVP